MTVSDTAWVDNGGFRPNAGQFPIQVERHLNAFVADHLPGVTTVTAGARYYTLHGVTAHVAQRDGLDEAAAIRLVRRCEVLLAFVTHRHSASPEHLPQTPAGHGIDAILRISGSAGVDLASCAADKAYSLTKWGFSGAYRGSELTLKILDTSGYVPGAWHDPTATAALAALVERAQGADEVSDVEADELVDACLCRMAGCTDGPWLAKLLAGEPASLDTKPTLGGLLWQLGRAVSTAITMKPVGGAGDLADALMYDHDLAHHPALIGMIAPARWRGALLRAESVWAWRRIWRDINVNHLGDGAMAVTDLARSFGDSLSQTPVVAFRAGLPKVIDDAARPLPAERQLDHLTTVEQWLAIVMLGAERAHHLTDEERVGYTGRNEIHAGQWEELTPGWTEQLLDRHAGSSVQQLGRDVAMILINRSQRVALRKATFNPRTQTFNYPARMHVRDGIAVKVYGETAPQPATRLPQYLSIARQAGLYALDDNKRLELGPHGSVLA